MIITAVLLVLYPLLQRPQGPGVSQETINFVPFKRHHFSMDLSGSFRSSSDWNVPAPSRSEGSHLQVMSRTKAESKTTVLKVPKIGSQRAERQCMRCHLNSVEAVQ